MMMNDLQLLAWCDDNLRYAKSNTGIRGISYNDYRSMHAVRYDKEYFGQFGCLESAFDTLIKAYGLYLTAHQQSLAINYLTGGNDDFKAFA
jgi:hypothetical protein